MVEPAKAGPAMDWSEIESRLPEISAGAKQAGDEPLDLAPEASATLANDPSLASDPPPANDSPATVDQPVSVGDDPLDRLSLLVTIPSNRSCKPFASLQGSIMSERSKTASIQKHTLETNAHAAVPEFQVETSSMTTATTRKREIAFIDRGVDDLETLLAGIRPDVEPILPANDEPAPRQMARAVQGREGQLDAIHVIAHGRPGEVSFSAGALTLETIDQYAADLAAAGAAVGSHGDLRLWSCAVADGELGAAFIDAVARASNMYVTAAAGPVGATMHGGSWELVALGAPVSVRAPLCIEGQAAYAGVLDTNNTTISGSNATGGRRPPAHGRPVSVALPSRSRPSWPRSPRDDCSPRSSGSDEQMFGAKQQVPHGGDATKKREIR